MISAVARLRRPACLRPFLLGLMLLVSGVAHADPDYLMMWSPYGGGWAYPPACVHQIDRPTAEQCYTNSVQADPHFTVQAWTLNTSQYDYTAGVMDSYFTPPSIVANIQVVPDGCPFGGTPGYTAAVPISTIAPDWCLFGLNPERNAGCPCKNGAKAAKTGDPINTAAGNVYESATDYTGSGPFPLIFSRSYNSILANQASSPGHGGENLGQGWTSNIGSHIYLNNVLPMYACQETAGSHRVFQCPTGGYSGSGTLVATLWHADGSQAVFDYSSMTGPDGTALSPESYASGQLFFVSTLPSPASGSGFRYLRDDGNTEYYDSTGRLVLVRDTHGLQQVYAYGTGGNLTSITDPTGRALTFTYDASNRVQTMTDPASRVYTYTYDANNNLASVTYPDSTNPSGVVLTYKYENTSYVHALTGVVDENNSRYATWGYDSSGRATSTYLGLSTLKANSFTVGYTTDGNGKITVARITEPTTLARNVNFNISNYMSMMSSVASPCSECGDTSQSATYDTNGFLSSTTDFRGSVTQYVHDATGLETSRTEAYGTADARTITTTWDASRQPALITEAGRTTAYTYDTTGRVLTKTVTDTATSTARTTTYTYNTLGLLDTVDGPRTDVSDITSYGYDTYGNLTSVTNALSQTIQITAFDADGKPTTIVDPNGVTTVLAYDARQRLTSKTVNGTEVTTFTYDNAGELTKVTQPDGSYLQYGYDSAHRVTSVTDNLGNKIVYTLDGVGNRTKEQTKDPAGTIRRTLTRTYDNLNHLHQLIGGLNQTTTYTDDNLGNPTTITDPMTHATTQVFDALSRLQSVTDPYSGTTTYNEDALDHVTDVTDPRGLNTHYDYDAFGDVILLNSPDTGTTTYTYDLAGNRLTKTDAASITATYTYDALNRLTSVSYPDTSKNITYTYDSGTYGKGHLTGITDASGSTAYTYDAWGNLTGKTVVEGGHTFTVGYSYDLANRLASITYPDTMVVAYTRDSTGQITTVKENGNNVASSITYKPFGPVAGLTYGNTLVETRTYDADYRITGISIPSVQGLTFGYNANDDITGITDSISASNTQTLGYDNLNRLTSAVSGTGGYGSLTYGYDADGNRTSLINGAGTATYTLDTLSNQLDSISGATTATYSYNAIGALDNDGTNQYVYADTERLDTVTNISTSATVATYVYNGLGQRTGKTTSAGTSLFVYDESGNLLGEYDASGNLVQEHIWLNSMPIGVINSTALYYVQTDQLNTPRIVTNTSHNIVWSWKSDPFGINAPSGSLTYNLRFLGQYHDVESGRSYNSTRDYDASIARYIESDSIGLHGGINTYEYVLGNPIGLIDKHGTATLTIPIDITVPDSVALPLSELAPLLIPAVMVLSLAGDTPCPKKCPACSPYPVGTIGYLGPHTDDHFNKTLGRNLNPHLNLFEVNQNKADCKCRWNKSKPDSAEPPAQPGWVDLNSGFPALSP